MLRPKRKAPPSPARKRYVLNEQVGFLLRVAMQRHTTIFTSRMIEELTQTQFAALAKLLEAGPCSQNHLGRLIISMPRPSRAWSTGCARAGWWLRRATRGTAAAAP